MKPILMLSILTMVKRCSNEESRDSVTSGHCSKHFYHEDRHKCPAANYFGAAGARAGTGSYTRLGRADSEKNQHYVSLVSRWNFPSNHLLFESFPIDPIAENYERRVKNVIFSQVIPTPLQYKAELVAYSEDVLSGLLDLHLSVVETEAFIAFVSGNTYLGDVTPLAHRYGGHQFGGWSGQLGDGRAHLLGEYINRNGERWELQLKGSGKTPYSRRGDGRAVLRSSVREFLASEAMFHLGVPTSRAASLVVSEDPVWRDQFYDGNPRQEKAAVVLRLAPSWFRIGSLEILARNGETDLLRLLTDFIIEHYFTEVQLEDDDRYLSFYTQVVNETASMIAKWQSIGFAHGVMNTDNFSLLSFTIDYGPFGFLDSYHPGFVPNTSDDEERYSYEKQPDVGLFNMHRLGDALSPLLSMQQKKQLSVIAAGYVDRYKTVFMGMFRKKLGLTGTEERDEYLLAMLLKMMEDTHSDFTMTFRNLGAVSIATLKSSTWDIGKLWALADLSRHEMFTEWARLYSERLGISTDEEEARRMTGMNAVNPNYVLRNWMAQSAIEDAEKGNFATIRELHKILRRPFDNQPEAERKGYSDRPPKWAKGVKVSCSS